MKNLSKFRPQHRLVYDTFMKLTTDLKKDMEKKEALDFQGQQDDEDRVRYNDYDYFEEYFNYWVMSLDFSHGSPIPPQLGEGFILELETNIFSKYKCEHFEKYVLPLLKEENGGRERRIGFELYRYGNLYKRMKNVYNKNFHQLFLHGWDRRNLTECDELTLATVHVLPTGWLELETFVVQKKVDIITIDDDEDEDEDDDEDEVEDE